MLTSHLLFVGFGFAESDFSDMYAAVSSARALATQVDEDEAAFGTTITLKSEGEQRHPEIISLSTGQDGDEEASRRLEILLDRVAWAAQIVVRSVRRTSWTLHTRRRPPRMLKVRRAVEELTMIAEEESASPVRTAVVELRRRLGSS